MDKSKIEVGSVEASSCKVTFQSHFEGLNLDQIFGTNLLGVEKVVTTVI